MTPIKVTVFINIPTKEHPKFNFVGKLLGPGGNSLKRLQQDTHTKMAIQGRGSMRDKEKEEELRQQGEPKYLHLRDDLHLKIDAYAPAEESYSRIANAIRMTQPFLVPDMHDSIGQDQMSHMSSGGRGRGRGDGRRGGRIINDRAESFYGRDMAPASRSYDDYRSRDPYSASAGPAAEYEREPRGPPRDYYDSYAQPRATESSRDRYGEYPPSRPTSWGSQGNGYSSGGYGKSSAPRGGRGSDRSHPYGRGGRSGAF